MGLLLATAFIRASFAMVENFASNFGLAYANVSYTQKLSPLTITAAPMSRIGSSFFGSITMTCTAQLTSGCNGLSHIEGALQGDRHDKSFEIPRELHRQSHRVLAPESVKRGTRRFCNNNKQLLCHIFLYGMTQ